MSRVNFPNTGSCLLNTTWSALSRIFHHPGTSSQIRTGFTKERVCYLLCVTDAVAVSTGTPQSDVPDKDGEEE